MEVPSVKKAGSACPGHTSLLASPQPFPTQSTCLMAELALVVLIVVIGVTSLRNHQGAARKETDHAQVLEGVLGRAHEHHSKARHP